jgi:glycine/D-amino acid oxidase-like deaminating enzyme
MRKNTSPWLHQLDQERQRKELRTDLETDVAIIGAGIAGVASAFYLLKYTDKRVVMLERFKLAHGATGHNAGQVVSYFERGFASLTEEFGLKRAGEGQRAIEDAWELIEEMYTEAGLDIPLSRFLGHAGLSSYDHIIWHLRNTLLRKKAGLNPEQLLISKESGCANLIPAEYTGLYVLAPQEEILSLLETERKDFVAVLSYQKGCINSALFCQEMITYLLKKYPERFTLYEYTPVHKVILHHGYAVLDADTHTVTVDRVVLCTNGFKSIHILNKSGLDIDAKYHHLLSGKIGYMSGYLEKMNKQPTAISYFTDPIPSIDNSYYYLTRRPYEYEQGVEHNLISVGGPDVNLDDASPYSHEDDYPDEMGEEIDRFVRTVYDSQPNKKIDYIFTWHGLMGYTKNKVRFIGPEPKNPVLLYNLGCNGVGILPSVYGGKKIARHIAGERVEKTIFDVPVRE